MSKVISKIISIFNEAVRSIDLPILINLDRQKKYVAVSVPKSFYLCKEQFDWILSSDKTIEELSSIGFQSLNLVEEQVIGLPGTSAVELGIPLDSVEIRLVFNSGDNAEKCYDLIFGLVADSKIRQPVHLEGDN